MSDILNREALDELVGVWIKEGRRVIAPVQVKSDCVLYQRIAEPGQITLQGYVHPRNAIKEFFFPRTEPIYQYKFSGSNVELKDIDPPDTPQIILGARACDAAFAPILDKVFNWDSKDKFYNVRRESTTIVTLACAEFDGDCFCTSVGLSPDAIRGADAMLLHTESGNFVVRCFTEKGEKLFAGKTHAGDEAGIVSPGPEKKFDALDMAKFIRENFNHPIWDEIALQCIGCGACAYTCPTCHCFDIVDEGNAAGGSRVKNWDSCQFSRFTVHASGHNPRSNQGHRQRQRLLHKFSIYPDKFDELLCTGCGDCTRNCPVSLGVLTSMLQIKDTIAREAD